MPHALNDDYEQAFETHLRDFQPAMPALDRDQLMFRAGQKTVPRPQKTWPALAIASWAVCAALLGVLIWRPAEVVTKTRVVERIVRVPVEPVDRTVPESSPKPERRERYATVIPQEEIWTLADLKGPLTAGGWRLDVNDAFNSHPAMAAVPPEAATDSPPALWERPKTYGELRRALMNGTWDGFM